MGSITSRPRVPQVQTVYVPQYTAPAVAAVAQPVAENGSADAEQSAQDAVETREDGLLRRNRGRYGTVSTSFRGLLSAAADRDDGRKTLLGE